MFNEYSVYQMVKFRQDETESKAKNAWKFFVNPTDENSSEEITSQTKPTVNPCCQCACA
nr:hypothetical protein [Neobacillus sp. Marseille-Q6967]